MKSWALISFYLEKQRGNLKLSIMVLVMIIKLISLLEEKFRLLNHHKTLNVVADGSAPKTPSWLSLAY